MSQLTRQRRRFVRQEIAHYATSYGYSGGQLLRVRENAGMLATWHFPPKPPPINRRFRRRIRQEVCWGDVLRILSPTFTNRRIARAHRGEGRYVVLCPFHDEKTPSLVMFPNGLFKCHGCGKAGDIVSFVDCFLPLRTTHDIKAFFGPLMQPLSSA